MILLGAQSVALLAAVPALHLPVLAPVAAFMVGTLSLALAPVVQTLVLDTARDAPVLASASMQSVSTSRTRSVPRWAACAGRRIRLRRAPRRRGHLGGPRRGVAVVARRRARVSGGSRTQQAAVAVSD